MDALYTHSIHNFRLDFPFGCGYNRLCNIKFAPLAQLDRATDFSKWCIRNWIATEIGAFAEKKESVKWRMLYR